MRHIDNLIIPLLSQRVYSYVESVRLPYDPSQYLFMTDREFEFDSFDCGVTVAEASLRY